MKGKYHIGLQGKPGLCRATYVCPYGDNSEHFDSFEEAQLHADKINEKRINSIDLKEGQPHDIARRIDYDLLERRTIKEQGLLEINRIENLVTKELEYLKKRYDDIPKEQMFKSKELLEVYKREGVALFYADEVQNSEIEPDIYDFAKKNVVQRTNGAWMAVKRENDFTKNDSLLSKITRNEKFVEYESVFDDNVDLSDKNYPDVLGTQMIIKNKKGEIIEKHMLSKEDCDTLGVLAPGDNLISRLKYKYRGENPSKKGPLLSIDIKNQISLDSLIAKKSAYLKRELKDFEVLEKRIANYEKLLKKIESIKSQKK